MSKNENELGVKVIKMVELTRFLKSKIDLMISIKMKIEAPNDLELKELIENWFEAFKESSQDCQSLRKKRKKIVNCFYVALDSGLFGKIAAPRLESVTNSSVSLSWSVNTTIRWPRDPTLSLLLQWRHDGQVGGAWHNVSVPSPPPQSSTSSTASVTIPGLEAFTNYRVRLNVRESYGTWRDGRCSNLTFCFSCFSFVWCQFWQPIESHLSRKRHGRFALYHTVYPLVRPSILWFSPLIPRVSLSAGTLQPISTALYSLMFSQSRRNPTDTVL